MSKVFHRFVALGLMTALGSSIALTQATLPAGITAGPTLEGLSEFRLANGLKVVVFPDDSRTTITTNITYLVGSRHEGYGERGSAHLLEHLVFKGTPTNPNIPAQFKERGANFNGTTSDDRTNYFMTFPASDDNLNWALGLEADRMVNSFIAKKDLESEYSVVRNEFENGENNPANVLFKQVRSAAYDWHNYGNSTIGNRSDIESIPIERLQAFYKNYYQPDNAVLVVTGKVNTPKVLEQIAASFGKIAKPTRKLEATYTTEPTQDGERTVTVQRVGTQQIAVAAYRMPSGLHPDYPAVDVLADILGGSDSSRLYEELVKSKKALEANAFVSARLEPSLLYNFVYAEKTANLNEIRELLLKTVESVATNAPSQIEVDRIKALNEAGFDQLLAKSDRVGTALSEYIALGDWRLMFYFRDAIQKVTPADVARVAAKYLKPLNRTVGLFIPTDNASKTEISAAPIADKVLQGYTGRAAVAGGETLDPDAGKLEARVSRENTVIRNGLISKTTRAEKIEFALNLRFGDAQSLKNRLVVGTVAAAMIARGSEGLTKQQLADELTKLKSTMVVTGGATGASVRISSDKQNLEAVLKLMGTVLRKPAFPADEFDAYKKAVINSIEAQKLDPAAVAQRAYSRHIMPKTAMRGDVLYVYTFDELLEEYNKVTLDDVKAFYKDFWGSSAAFLGAAGQFDNAALRSSLGVLIGDWKNAKAFARVPSVATEPDAVNQTFNIPDKANAYFYAAQNLKMRDDHPDYPALVMANFMFGGGSISSRLADRLRQKDGLSYSVGSGFNISSFDEYANFLAVAIYAPQNVDKVEAGFKEELEKALKDGFSATEFEAAKKGYLEAARTGRSNDANLAGQLASQMELNRTYAFTADFETKINALTVEQINTAFKRHISLAKVSIFKAGTFSK